MDNIDRRILHCLRENARTSASAIASRVSLSVPSVIDRIRKLEHDGVVRRYTALLDNSLIGRNLLAFISVGVDQPQSIDDLERFARKTAGVVECYYVTGDLDFLLKVSVADSSELEQIIRSLKHISGVSTTKTQVVLSTTKDESWINQEYIREPEAPPK